MTAARQAGGAAATGTAARADPFVATVADYAERVLRPAATRTDREGVARERIAELAELGALNHLAPPEFGGRGVDSATDRRVHEIIAGACFNTWLVWAQHAALPGRLAEAAAKGARLSPLAEGVLRGAVFAGAGVSDVRRYPDYYVAARNTHGGWVFDGTLSWVSGWGLNEVLTVAAVEPESETVVTALVPVGESTRSTGALALGAVAGSRTERVRLDEVFVPGEHVLQVQSLEQARHTDIGIASDARGHHFGLAETLLRELDDTGDPLARDVAGTWRPRVARIRADAYALADEAKAAGGGPYRLDERLATKVASGEALSTLSRALLIARSGRGLAADDTAQLHARSALFVLVQGQTADVRRAQLAALAH